MNKMRCLLAAMAVLFVMAGCGKKADVAFSTSTIEITPEGGSVLVPLTSNGDWDVTTDADWLTVSPSYGSGDATLELTASVNDSDNTRTAQVLATTKDREAKLTVTQEPREKNTVSVTPSEKTMDFEGGTFEIAVTANCDWTVNCVADWIGFDPASGTGNGTVTVTVEPMEGDFSSREANIFFGGSENELVPVHVIQYAEVHVLVEIDPSILQFDYQGGEQLVAVSCEGGWTVSNDADWVVLSASEGQGSADVTVTVAENTGVLEARAANVSFASETGAVATLLIKQEGAPDPHYLEVTPTLLSFGKEGGTQQVNISCDDYWEVEIQADWLMAEQANGTGDAVLAITAAPNTIQETRNASFVVVSGSLSRTVYVAQEAGDAPLEVTLAPDTLNASYSGGTYPFTVTANTSWTLEASAWVAYLLPSSGEGDASVSAVVDINNSEEPRYGYIRALHNGVVMSEMVVAQEGRPSILETDITEINARPEGGEYTIHVTSNQSWNIETNVDWLVCNPSSGTGNGEFVVTIDPMTGLQPRSTELRIYGSYGSTVFIKVTQSN